MTGGTVVILGQVGDNFAAGMTGGMAFIFDEKNEFEKKVNPETVILGFGQRRHCRQRRRMPSFGGGSRSRAERI